MSVFHYAALRAMPCVERGEFINVGVVLYCQERDFLAAQLHLNPDRLRALRPDIDVTAVGEALAAVDRACSGAGLVGELSLRQRFGWLTAPRSTVLQPGPVHLGLADDPAQELQRLHDRLVR